ncbi:hypothetical protein GCM10009560_00490 [Nonomuraea longicatena]|uniref:Uncharacterized protein n=1 Tax=Nonomuraea longicatena TaxID=83682 RepID=A0ABP3Z1I8_9ACTN
MGQHSSPSPRARDAASGKRRWIAVAAGVAAIAAASTVGLAAMTDSQNATAMNLPPGHPSNPASAGVPAGGAPPRR